MQPAPSPLPQSKEGQNATPGHQDKPAAFFLAKVLRGVPQGRGSAPCPNRHERNLRARCPTGASSWPKYPGGGPQGRGQSPQHTARNRCHVQTRAYLTRMTTQRSISIATGIVAAAGLLWGLYWLPVRALDGLGLPGAWGTVAITLAATLLIAPLALARRRDLAATPLLALLAIATGGAAFALYSMSLVYGRVAIVILLYFLTPVWSTLIGRYVMGWPATPLRVAAILLGLAGLGIMLGADGTLPRPQGIGEWMALVAGLLWSIGTTGMRTSSTLAPGPSAFVFAAGAAVTALVLAPLLAPLPGGAEGSILRAGAVALGTGALWWGLSIAALMWATLRLEPARVGILLMTEVLVGALSAALLAGEHLSGVEIAGGALVLAAGVLEVWPTRKREA